MHGLHVVCRNIRIWFRIVGCALILLPVTCAQQEVAAKSDAEGTESPFAVSIDADRVTQFDCRVGITGTLTTPATNGARKWVLDSQADFSFSQRRLPSELSGPLALQALRQYSKAEARTSVGKDHETKTTLPRDNSLIHIRGADTGLSVAAAALPLSRGQYDLLQMPCDPLPCSSLLPSRNVTVGEKWNTDAWVFPRLVGFEAVTDQTLSCELKSLTGDVAEIHFQGTADGAVLGSASSVELTGMLTLDTKSRMLTRLSCQMKEKRSPGPVSPGLDVSVNVSWTQSLTGAAKVPAELNESLFSRPLALQTPWHLVFSHSSEWHVFNQTEGVIMLRQIRDGALISQCNISAGVVMPAGQHTADADFRSDVEAAILTRSGQLTSEETVRDDKQWRMRHLRASGSVNNVEIIWDYYLCAAASGEQFSLMFSHGAADNEAFGDESTQLLNSLSLARRRPALPFR
jgi:hypothetical protein